MFRHPQSTPARSQQQQHQFGGDYNIKVPKAPDRPLAPYMRFSRKMWPKVRAENPDAQIWDIGKIIGKMWKDINDAERAIYQHEFDVERTDYEKQLKNYQNSPGYLQMMGAKVQNRAKANEKGSRSRMDAGGVVIQPIDEEDAGSELSNRRLAAVRYDRNHRLISDLFSPAIVTDTRTIVAQQRMEMLRKQATSLALHQSKLEEELGKLETIHVERKRQVEKNADEFQSALKKVCDEKPVVDEKIFEENVAEFEGKLVEAYEEYKKKEEEIRVKQELAAKAAETSPVLRDLVMNDDSGKEGQTTKAGGDEDVAAAADGVEKKKEATPKEEPAETKSASATPGEPMDTSEAPNEPPTTTDDETSQDATNDNKADEPQKNPSAADTNSSEPPAPTESEADAVDGDADA